MVTLEQLAASDDIRDRAFAASALALGHGAEAREQVALLYRRVDETASRHHAALRARIRDGTLERAAFIAELEAAPLDVRDHLVEEILGIAYPPLEPIARDRDRYYPSGLSEILFMLRHAGLGPHSTFVDLGAGLGKVTLLVALLTGARAIGLELDPVLVRHGRAAAASLNLESVELLQADIREAALPPADVYYMFIPFLGSADVVQRLASSAAPRKVRLFCQTLDLKGLPWLRATGSKSYWLEAYEGSDPR